MLTVAVIKWNIDLGVPYSVTVGHWVQPPSSLFLAAELLEI